jgi:hypothetical protein
LGLHQTLVSDVIGLKDSYPTLLFPISLLKNNLLEQLQLHPPFLRRYLLVILIILPPESHLPKRHGPVLVGS